MENKFFIVIVLLLSITVFSACNKKTADKPLTENIPAAEETQNHDADVIRREAEEDKQKQKKAELQEQLEKTPLIKKVDGTWVHHTDLLRSPSIRDMVFSWGVGKSIAETSIDIDLNEDEILMPGHGGYRINSVSKNENESVALNLYSMGREDITIKLEFTFIDNNRAYIVCYFSFDYYSYKLSPEKPRIWYRLSGPD